MTHEVLAHWFWSAFFVLFGIYLVRRSFLGAPVCAACSIRVKDGGGDDGVNRIAAAVERREQAEGPAPRLGVWTGIPCIALGFIAAFTNVQSATLYAVMCLMLAAGTAAGFLRLKNSQSKRVAVLASRTPNSVIPSYWFAIGAASALSVLAFANDPRYVASALFVCVASLTATAIAWRLTQLPALWSGVDVPAEMAVDDRLRFVRSAVVLFYALAQTFVFCAQPTIAQPSALQTAAYIWNWIPWIAFAIWMVWRLRQSRTLAPA